MKIVNPPKLVDTDTLCKQVISTINELSGIDIRKRDKRVDIVIYRTVCMNILSKYFKLSSTEIGKLLNRDHSTVLHAKSKNTDNSDYDKVYEKCLNSVSHLIIKFDTQYQEYIAKYRKNIEKVRDRYRTGQYTDFCKRINSVVNNYFNVDITTKERKPINKLKAKKIFCRIAVDETNTKFRYIAKHIGMDRTTMTYHCKTCIELIESDFLYDDYKNICNLLSVPVRYHPKRIVKKAILTEANEPKLRVPSNYSNKKHIDYDT